MPDVERLLTLKDVALQLQVSERTVRELVRQQRLASVRVGRLLRFEEGALAAFIKQHRTPAEPGSQHPAASVPTAAAPLDQDRLEALARKHRLG